MLVSPTSAYDLFPYCEGLFSMSQALSMAAASTSMRLLLVTFDLTKTIPGDGRYAQADAALSFNGMLFKPLKQIRFLVTSRDPMRIQAALEQRIGRQCGILVIPVQSIAAWRIYQQSKRKEWDKLIAILRKFRISVDGIREVHASNT